MKQTSTSLPSETEKAAAAAQDLPAFRGLNLLGIRETVREALAEFGKFSIFEEYTKHDISHIDSMLKIYDWLVPSETRAAMTPSDWLLVTVSTYLHDFGLLVTRDEYDRRDQTEYPNYREGILFGHDERNQDYRAQLADMDARASERFLYQEFVRKNHARRIRSWLTENPDPRLGFDDALARCLRAVLAGIEETFVEDVGIVAESHHLDDLADIAKYPVRRPYGASPLEEANVQYTALLLRTADLLHIARDRVPAVSALVVNPRNPKSQTEWAKQAAVRTVRPKPVSPDESGDTPRQDTVEVHATFKEPEGYFGLTSYLQYAGTQLSQSHRWAAESQALTGGRYAFPWRKIDTDNITARGFVAEQFQFSIDQAKILDLLTGHTLYNDTSVVVRELLQNSLDATRLHQHMGVEDGYVPRIEVAWDSETKTLSVLDNGTGMSQRVIEENFLRVGASRYQSPEFSKEFPDYAPISRFGIGVLSAFMVADHVTVVTSSPEDEMARHLDLRDVHGMYLIRLLEKESDQVPAQMRAHGTLVTLQLRPSATILDVHQMLEWWIVLPGCEVTLTIDGGPQAVIGAPDLSSALERSLLLAGVVHRVEGEGLQSTFGSPVEIREFSEGETQVAYAVSWNKWLREWSFLTASHRFIYGGDTDIQERLGVCISGVRVTSTSPGYLTGGVIAMANASGKNAPRTNVARSAIERTDEYENFLTLVYRTYLSHVEREMGEFERARNASLTLAAREASYIAQAVASSDAQVVSQRRLAEAVRRVPSMVVEIRAERLRISLEGLQAYESLATYESATITRLESVLGSVRGNHNASLASLLDALGAESDVRGSELPIVCGLRDGGYFANLFLADWEPQSLSFFDESRELRVLWSRVGEPGLWHRAPGGRLPTELQMLAERDPEVARGRRVVFARSGAVACEGFSETLVASHGRLLVLPEHSVNRVRGFLDDSDSAPERLWIMQWIIRATTGSSRANWASYFGESPVRRVDPAQILSILRASGAFRYVTETSVTEALDDLSVEILDVSRWDRGAAVE